MLFLCREIGKVWVYPQIPQMDTDCGKNSPSENRFFDKGFFSEVFHS